MPLNPVEGVFKDPVSKILLLSPTFQIRVDIRNSMQSRCGSLGTETVVQAAPCHDARASYCSKGLAFKVQVQVPVQNDYLLADRCNEGDRP